MSQSQTRTTRRSPGHNTPGPESAPAKRRGSPSPLSLRLPGVQTKLEVNDPGDHFEVEADAVADAVMRAPVAGPPAGIDEGASGIQRQTQPQDDTVQLQTMPDDEETLQRQEMPDDEETLQRQKQPDEEMIQRDGDGKPGVSAQTAATIRTPGVGDSLPAATRGRIEPQVGADLSDVRVHTDTRAAEAASSLRARAFTYDNHIFLNAAESPGDVGLMAHESAHVVQQGGVVRRQPQDETQQQSMSAESTSATAQAAASTAASAESSAATTQAAAAPTTASAESTAAATTATSAEAATAETGAVGTQTAEPGAAPETQAAARTGAAAEQGAATTPAAGQAAPQAASAETGAASAVATTGEGAGAAGVKLLMPEPPAELGPQAWQRLAGVERRAGRTTRAEKTMPSAASNVGGARQAVTEPQAETQARAEEATVKHLDERPEPSAEIEDLCDRIRQVIRDKRPPDEDSLVDADPQAMAEASGQQMNSSVEGDAQRVQGEYNSMQGQQTGTPAQQAPPLQNQPAAESTPGINAAQAAPDAVPAENVSLDADVEANRQRMEEAGMNSTTAQAVQSGPIAEARAAQGELEQTAQRDPAQVMAEQEQAIASAQADMTDLQARAVAALERSRSNATTGTEGQQTKMVGSEEQMREQAGRRANQIFDTARNDVDGLLRDMPRTAMQKWEAGIARHSATFERSLQRVEHWINERHSGAGGAILGVWDAVTGLPDWVTDEYDRAEREFGDNVCDLIRDISRDVNAVVASCQAIIQRANDDINALYDSLPAELQEWAQGEKARFGERLNDLSNHANQTRDNFNRDLRQRAGQAVQQVRERINELRQAARGLIGRIADAVAAFIDDPVRAIINGLLDLVGISPASFWALVNRIAQVISDIANDPLTFANNLMEALKQGFQQFFDNIGTHLLNGLLNWLFGAMGDVGVTIPGDFSLKSLITFFLQLMGITWARIRALLAKHVGEQNVALIEQAWQLIGTLIEQGPQGIFEMIKDQFNPQTIIDMIMQAAIDYMEETLIKQVAIRIIGMLNPAGAIVQAIELIYKLLKWLFENAARIFSLIETIVNGVADILAGNIGGMATAVENALARILPIVIDFLADLLGLGDLPDKIADKVKQLQDWVERMLDRAIGWLADRAWGLLSRLTGGGAGAEATANSSVTERWSQGMSAVRQIARQADAQNLDQTSVNRRLGSIKEQYGFSILMATAKDGKLQIHAVMNPEDWVDIDDEDTVTEESLWESVASQVTQAGPPDIRLSASSASFTQNVLEGFIDRSPATQPRKDQVRGLVSQRIQAAVDATDSHQIYILLRQVAGMVNSLYSSAPSGVRPNLQVHHEQEVADYPDTFVETRLGRIYVRRALQTQVRRRVSSMQNLSPQQQEEQRRAIIALVREQIMDDERTEMQAPLDEIDLIAVTTRVHIEIHRQRRNSG